MSHGAEEKRAMVAGMAKAISRLCGYAASATPNDACKQAAEDLYHLFEPAPHKYAIDEDLTRQQIKQLGYDLAMVAMGQRDTQIERLARNAGIVIPQFFLAFQDGYLTWEGSSDPDYRPDTGETVHRAPVSRVPRDPRERELRRRNPLVYHGPVRSGPWPDMSGKQPPPPPKKNAQPFQDRFMLAAPPLRERRAAPPKKNPLHQGASKQAISANIRELMAKGYPQKQAVAIAMIESRKKNPAQPDDIEFDGDEIEAAEHWHGGQSSMLYAVASTGTLSRGTIRPRHEDGRAMTDHEWMVDLAERLESEAEDAASDAEDAEDAAALESIAAKARRVIEARA